MKRLCLDLVLLCELVVEMLVVVAVLVEEVLAVVGVGLCGWGSLCPVVMSSCGEEFGCEGKTGERMV